MPWRRAIIQWELFRKACLHSCFECAYRSDRCSALRCCTYVCRTYVRSYLENNIEIRSKGDERYPFMLSYYLGKKVQIELGEVQQVDHPRRIYNSSQRKWDSVAFRAPEISADQYITSYRTITPHVTVPLHHTPWIRFVHSTPTQTESGNDIHCMEITDAQIYIVRLYKVQVTSGSDNTCCCPPAAEQT